MKKYKIRKILISILLIQGVSYTNMYADVKESPLYNFESFNFDTKEIIYDESEPVFMYKNGPQVTIPDKYENPKIQFRGVWISTVANIDIGNVENDQKLSAEEEFKEKYNKILDVCDEYNLNAVIFQVSPMLDAWYKSDLAPWSQYLHKDGKDYKYQGKDPGFGKFDPLKWMIEETHKRGMEFHAWFNPYRVTNDSSDNRSKDEKLKELAKNNFARLNPNLVYEFQNKLFLDPGKEEVINYVIQRIEEVATKYDIDAVHFDDYFYPYSYSENGRTIYFSKEGIDKQTFLDNNRGFGEYNSENITKWRENNINLLISGVKKKIDEINKKTEKSIQFGVSPAGIWGHAESQAGGSLTANGGIATLRDQFADTKRWAQEGWIDYLIPQIYWAFNNNSSPYGELVEWWNEQFNNIEKCDLYIGHPYYKMTDAVDDNNFNNPYEIANQLRFNQKYKNIKGSAFFSLRKLYFQNISNKGDKNDVLNNCNEILKEDYLNYKANIPPKEWLDNVKTNAVTQFRVNTTNNKKQLTWKDDNKDSKFYCVYREEGNLEHVDINNPENLIARFGIENGTKFIDDSAEEGKQYTYAVTIIDKAGLESEQNIGITSKLVTNSSTKRKGSLVLMIIGLLIAGLAYYLFEKDKMF